MAGEGNPHMRTAVGQPRKSYIGWGMMKSYLGGSVGLQSREA